MNRENCDSGKGPEAIRTRGVSGLGEGHTRVLDSSGITEVIEDRGWRSVEINPNSELMRQVRDALVVYLSSQPDRTAKAGDCQRAVCQMIERQVNPATMRVLRRHLGIELSYQRAVAYWTLPKHLVPEVTEADRKMARAMVRGKVGFATLWRQASGRHQQVAEALVELARLAK